MNEKPYINWAKEQLGEIIEIVKDEYGDQSDVFGEVWSKERGR